MSLGTGPFGAFQGFSPSSSVNSVRSERWSAAVLAGEVNKSVSRRHVWGLRVIFTERRSDTMGLTAAK